MELFHKAVEALDAILALDPLQEEVWNIKALCHYNMGDIDEALKCCDKAIEIAPRYSRTWVNRGFLLNRQRRYDDALLCFERALEIEYRLPEAFINRGVTMCLRGEPERAFADYKIALEIRQNTAIFWYNMGLWYACKGRLEESMKSFDATIALDNTLVDAWVDRAVVQITLNLLGEAQTLAEKAAQIDPRNHRTWFLQGYIMTRQDDRQEVLRMAVRNYDKSLRLKGDFLPALLARGVALRQLGRNEEAEESFIRAKQVSSPENQEENLNPEEYLKPSMLYNTPCDIHFQYEFSIRPHGHILFQE
jgi:tetratricopeptide (TPR) repeat protein